MSGLVVYGAPYSVYVRIVRLVLEEKGADYLLEPVDIFADEGVPAGYLERHPFGKIPAVAHDGFRLYETVAITQYLDEVLPGPALTPEAPQAQARMRQIIAVLDSYGYRPFVWDLFVERVRKPQEGGTSDEAVIAAGLEKSRACLRALADLRDGTDLFLGDRPSLADCHAYPMLRYMQLAPEGSALLEETGWPMRFLETMARRPGVAATRSPLEPQD